MVGTYDMFQVQPVLDLFLGGDVMNYVALAGETGADRMDGAVHR